MKKLEEEKVRKEKEQRLGKVLKKKEEIKQRRKELICRELVEEMAEQIEKKIRKKVEEYKEVLEEIEKLLRKRKRNGQTKYRKKGREREILQEGGHVEEAISKACSASKFNDCELVGRVNGDEHMVTTYAQPLLSLSSRLAENTENRGEMPKVRRKVKPKRRIFKRKHIREEIDDWGGHPIIVKTKETTGEKRKSEKENRKLREIKKDKTSISKKERENKRSKMKKENDKQKEWMQKWLKEKKSCQGETEVAKKAQREKEKYEVSKNTKMVEKVQVREGGKL